MPFPSNSEYEIDLNIGDVVTLVKKREDGWCKGTHHRYKFSIYRECYYFSTIMDTKYVKKF